MRFFLLGLALSLSLCLRAASPLPRVNPEEAGYSQAGIERMHRVLDKFVDDGSYAGYIVLLARDGKLVDWHAHGVKRLSSGEALAPNDIVRLFSMSKLITSSAILMLMEEGKLLLDDRIDKYLPALKDPKVYVGGSEEAPMLEAAGSPVTIRQLLNHTSGYYYDFSAKAPLDALINKSGIFDAQSMDDFVKRVSTLPLAHQPGTAFCYGISTDLLGAIVEKASGMPFDEFLESRIFRPLNMTDTGFSVPSEKLHRLARIHLRNKEGKLVEETFYTNEAEIVKRPAFCSGGGGLFSTAADYARFAQMLLNGGQLDGVRLLSRKTVELMTSNHIANLKVPHPFGQQDHGFGLGVRVLTDLGAGHSPGSVGCFGWDGMATTHIQIDPKERTVALLLFQHLPFEGGAVFPYFTNAYQSALAD